jgi:hypothetical protein
MNQIIKQQNSLGVVFTLVTSVLRRLKQAKEFISLGYTMKPHQKFKNKKHSPHLQWI